MYHEGIRDDRINEILFYGIATAGITDTIHHCGTFLRQTVNSKPVVLYLDAIQTEVLRVRGSSELYRWKSFQEIFGIYQRIKLYRLVRRPVSGAEKDFIVSRINKNMVLFNSPNPPPVPQRVFVTQPTHIRPQFM